MVMSWSVIWVWVLLGGAIGGILVALIWAAVAVGRKEDEARKRWIDDELSKNRWGDDQAHPWERREQRDQDS
jgi:hypothetical protein